MQQYPYDESAEPLLQSAYEKFLQLQQCENHPMQNSFGLIDGTCTPSCREAEEVVVDCILDCASITKDRFFDPSGRVTLGTLLMGPDSAEST